MELAALGGIRCRLWRLVHLRIFRLVSDHPRFSVGESFALQHRRDSAAGRSVPNLWETTSLSRQNFRIDLRRSQLFSLCVLRLRGGPKYNDVARPAEFYVDANGTVQWVNLTETIAVRATGASFERHQCDEGWPAIDAAWLT